MHIQWDAVPSERPGIAITAAGHHSPTQKGQRKGEKAQEDGGGGEGRPLRNSTGTSAFAVLALEPVHFKFTVVPTC